MYIYKVQIGTQKKAIKASSNLEALKKFLRMCKWYKEEEGYQHLDIMVECIDININKRKLNVELSNEEINERLSRWEKPEPKIKEGFLAFYSQVVKPAYEGAVVGTRF